ncbi:hypothetical protein FRC06_004541, partial [Ceratobasidium sp. 370]
MLPAYTSSWQVTRRQAGLFTCLAFSPAGNRLVVASKDGDVLLVDAEDGFILAKLGFGAVCSAQSLLWYSGSNLVLGCDNGSLYDTCFEPTNSEYSVTMNPLLTTFNQRIRLLAFDPDRCLLAVAYGNTVALYVYKVKGSNLEQKWEALELIKGPYNNEFGLVNALFFYPTGSGSRNLLIGYAEAGWSIWSKLGSVKRFSPDLSHNVCRIGSAALSSDEKSIAISTLDHAIVVYALESDGPILASMKEFQYEDNADITPIVPVAFTRDGLALGGTACGDVFVLRGTEGEMSIMRHVVGSTDRDGSMSILKCYSSSVIVANKARIGGELVTITADKALLGWEPSDSQWKAGSGTQGVKWRPAIGRTTRLWIFGTAVLLALMLCVDPPSGATFDEAEKFSEDTDLMVPVLQRHTYWLIFIRSYFAKYLWFQVKEWSIGIVVGAFSFIEGAAQGARIVWDLIGLGVAKVLCECIGVYKKSK